ncbi:Nif3-like dinuclear metal center hexameric protein [Sporosarcina sp. BI001-red]|uniref:Nif3-like dinuclear metal center hexameric protein n=1 Tax=Sporosarcina sp. BI001-red TaxID=2282866 RepID=UPI000E270682|nr:Nif3-like dinuclear metal center hexameric protein [Sporosarcina sp. BI001-red]REB10003.1 Nif3-like dinuclear metal center hexameric protein [Sporosarcina sp. BI001-red]
MKNVNGYEIIQVFEEWAPKKLAMEGDPIGLHIGQLNRPVDTVLVTLDVNETVVDEAIERGATLIIAHHPPLFRPAKHIWTDTPQGRMIEKCIKHDLSVYAAHTNLDIANGGVNDLLAEKLGLTQLKIIERTSVESGEEFGLGRVGILSSKMTLDQFACYVKEKLEVPAVRMVGDKDRLIQKVGVLGGDGNKYIYAAKRAGADVLVTGDLYYHVAQDAEAVDLCVVDPGHNVEKVMIRGVAEKMTAQCENRQYNVTFLQSQINTEPFTFV